MAPGPQGSGTWDLSRALLVVQMGGYEKLDTTEAMCLKHMV